MFVLVLKGKWATYKDINDPFDFFYKENGNNSEYWHQSIGFGHEYTAVWPTKFDLQKPLTNTPLGLFTGTVIIYHWEHKNVPDDLHITFKQFEY